jgi:CDP-diacylglycerol--serine O-phosphatidyltransferase
LISLVIANHAAGGLIGRSENTALILGVTMLIGFLMVSNVRFRSFKDIRWDTGTILLVVFVIASSAFVWQQFKPAFVLIWLLGVYVFIGIVESIRVLAQRLVGRDRQSVPPAESPP